jgi:hypothetical protein
MYIKAMLCQELEFNGVIKQHGLDEKKVTAAYRKAVTEALRDLMARKFVSERKALELPSDGTAQEFLPSTKMEQ